MNRIVPFIFQKFDQFVVNKQIIKLPNSQINLISQTANRETIFLTEEVVPEYKGGIVVHKPKVGISSRALCRTPPVTVVPNVAVVSNVVVCSTDVTVATRKRCKPSFVCRSCIWG